jgi:hypothetical protein
MINKSLRSGRRGSYDRDRALLLDKLARAVGERLLAVLARLRVRVSVAVTTPRLALRGGKGRAPELGRDDPDRRVTSSASHPEDLASDSHPLWPAGR